MNEFFGSLVVLLVFGAVFWSWWICRPSSMRRSLPSSDEFLKGIERDIEFWRQETERTREVNELLGFSVCDPPKENYNKKKIRSIDDEWDAPVV